MFNETIDHVQNTIAFVRVYYNCRNSSRLLLNDDVPPRARTRVCVKLTNNINKPRRFQGRRRRIKLPLRTPSPERCAPRCRLFSSANHRITVPMGPGGETGKERDILYSVFKKFENNSIRCTVNYTTRCCTTAKGYIVSTHRILYTSYSSVGRDV